jgi:hypothetical protein
LRLLGKDVDFWEVLDGRRGKDRRQPLTPSVPLSQRARGKPDPGSPIPDLKPLSSLSR